MNLKVANLIAVQFGIVIGTMSWLAYSRLPSDEPRTAAEMQERVVEPPADVAPLLEPRDQSPDSTDYRVERELPQPVAWKPAPTARYVQQIATQPYASSGFENGSIVADSPSYAEVDQEPALVSPDYVASPQLIAYPAQIVVFSNPRRFANRCRPTPHHGTRMTTTDRRPERAESHLSGCGPASRRNASAPSCRPTQGFKPRGNR